MVIRWQWWCDAGGGGCSASSLGGQQAPGTGSRVAVKALFIAKSVKLRVFLEEWALQVLYVRCCKHHECRIAVHADGAAGSDGVVEAKQAARAKLYSSA